MAKRERIPGRADTDRKKGLVFEKILRAWKLVPEMRLGELLSASSPGVPIRDWMLVSEDEELADASLAFAKHEAGVTVKKARR